MLFFYFFIMQWFWKIFCVYSSLHRYSVGRPKTFQNQSLFETAKYACKNVCLIKELRALPFNTNYNLNTCIECLPFLSIFSTRFRRDLLFYCFVLNRSISTVTFNLQTFVKSKKCSNQNVGNRFENEHNNLSRHVTSFLKKVLQIGQKEKKEKSIMVSFKKKYTHSGKE